MIHSKLALAALLAAALAGCATTDAPKAPVSVADTIAADPALSTLNGLVKQAGLTDALKGAGPYTVFAPTNDAFKAVLNYHVLPAKMTAAQVKNGKTKTANGADLQLSKAGEFVTVEEALVQTADINATNGVVHTVDRVLMPPKR